MVSFMGETTIIGLKLQTGVEYGPQLQEVLSNYACAIKTRIGLHETNDIRCETYGIVLLQVVDRHILKYLQNDIMNIDGIEMQVMKFN